MYGQGNYAPQFRHGPPATLPPPYQQGPPVPPPTYQQGPPAPPPPYHQGSPAPPPVYQQGPPPPPPPSFHHGPPAPPPSIHPGHPQLVQVPPPGMVNMGQPYLHPPPVHGSASVAPSYTTPQQTPQYPQNVHHVNPPVPPAPVPPHTGPSPPPPRMLPPPVPSPGQMLYRTSPPMPPHGTMQGLQHIRPLPPPPPSGFVPITPAPFASFTQGDAHPPSMPPPPPPPPPSSPPPLPPSPPPPSSPPPNNLAVGVSEASSLIYSNPALDMSHHSGSDFCSDKVSDSAERNSKPVDNEVGPTQVKDDASIPGGCTHSEIDTICKVDSVMVDGVAPKGQALIDLPLPPPKPVDEEVVRNIEILCQFIAKVGPEFENLARTKEAGNLKFAFLFGGEPGSAAAVGHEYFEWMKKKCHLEFKVRNESDQSDPAPRPSEIESSLQSISSIDDGLSVSPAVSDMDVEDDVNQSDKDEGIRQSIEDSKGEPALVCNEALLLKGQLHATQSSTKPLMQEDVSGTLSRSGSSPLFSGQGKEDDQSTFARSHTEDRSLVRSSSKAIECTLDSNMQASNKRLIEDSSPVKVSPPAGGGNSEEIPRVIIKDGSPFKLIQDYASDDSDDDKGTCLEDVSPVRVSPPVTQDISCVNEDKRNDMDSDLDVKNVSTTEIGFSIATGVTEAAQNSDSSTLLNKVASPIVMVPDSLDSGKKTDELSIHMDECQMLIGGTESSEAFNHNDALRGNDFDIDVQPEKFHQEVDAKRASTAVNVDEFGRLVREGGSDSDSDGMRYAGRRSKRGRSWSRSRSPQEGRWRRRSRSPWRRRDKRSRSRSWSPKKHRSRSKSPPAFRRMGEFGNEKMRRDNRSQPECFNFLRGRCYRGASCRFLHRDSAVGDARRWNRGKQEPYQEFQQDTRDPTLHGDAHYAVEAHEAKNSMGVELSADRHDFSHEEGKNLDVQTGLDMSLSSVEATKDEDLDDKKGQDSLKEDMQPAFSNEFGQSQVAITSGELSPSQGSKEVLDQIQEPQEAQLVQEGPGIQPPEEEGSQQPVESQETFQPPPADSLATGPEPVAETHKSPGDVIGETSVPQPPQSNISDSLSVPELQNVSTHPPHVEGSLTSHPLPVQTFPPSSFSNQPPQSQSYPNQVPLAPSYPDQMPLGQPYPNQVPGSQPFPSESFRPPPFPQPPSFPGGDFRFPPSQLPPPPQLHPSPSFPQDTLNAPHASHPPREHHLQQPGANFQSQPLPVERYPSHRPPFVDYHSQHAPPPNHPWASLPPPPFANESAPGPAIPNSDFRPLQFQQNPMLPRNNGPQLLSRPFPTDIPPQYRTFPSMEDPRQPSVDNLRDHSFGGSNFMREHRFMHPTMPEGQFNTGHLQDYHSHPLPPLREEVPGSHSVRENVGSFQPLQDPRITSSSSLTPQTLHSQPPPPFPREPSQMHSYGSQLPISGGFSSHMGVPGNVDSSLSRYPSSFPVGNQPSRLSDGAGLKTSTSTHYNPFASTFEQIPASLKSNSSISRREIDSNYSSKYDSPFRLSHGPVSVQGSGGPGARHMSSPPDSGRLGGQFLPKLGRELVAGDQYDPLFDSIEPSTNVFKKFDHVHGRDSTFEPISGSVAGRANETGIALRLSSLHGPLDVEEKRKDGVATIVKPPENDEFDGAAIDAEVGTVENASPQPGEGKNWSPANPIDLMNTAVGEIEIDQVQSPNKSKKSKDSRSMKLFKIAIADFVKEVLKPSWRQGNMSKEAFKTIVKKTVDKVSGAMQSHQIPKSQAKINQYVESSQRKLTKLVMGYVDKYTKI